MRYTRTIAVIMELLDPSRTKNSAKQIGYLSWNP